MKTYQELLELQPIPATVENLQIIMAHLNSQNWGSWELPKLTIGYSAHQYNCDGRIATTITLDRPIPTSEGRISRFSFGAPRGHLSKYHNIGRLSNL